MRILSVLLMTLAAVAVAQDCCEDPPGCGCPDNCSGVIIILNRQEEAFSN
jgi:hypothetical protein